MKALSCIGAVLLLAVVIAGFWVKREVNSMAEGAKFIIIMQRLGQFSTDLKRQGSFTNDILHLCDIYPFTNSVVVGGASHRCMLAAKAPSFGDSGIMAITFDDTVVWIDRDGKVTPFTGPDSIAP